MRPTILWSLVAVLAAAGCVTAGSAGPCTEAAKPAKAPVATKPAMPAKEATTASPARTAKASPAPAGGPSPRQIQAAFAAARAASAAKAAPPAEAPGRWPTYDAALAKAKAAHKPLLLDFSTAWCVACKLFDAKVEPDPAVHWLLHQVVFVQYDAEHGAGVGAATLFGVNAFPTFILVGDDGKVAWRQEGASADPEDFFDPFSHALSQVLTQAQLKAALAGKVPSAARLLTAQWDLAHGRTAEAKAQLEAAMKAKDAGTRGIGAQALRMIQSMQAGPLLVKLARHSDLALIHRYPASSGAAQAVDDLVRISPLKDAAVRAAARRVVEAETKAHDTDALNALVYTLLAGDLPKLAVAAAKTQTKLSPKDANAYDTLGEALLAAGRHQDAVAASKHAVALAKAKKDPEIGGYRADLARYEKGDPSSMVARTQQANRRFRASLDQIDPAGVLALLTAKQASHTHTPSVVDRLQAAFHAQLAATGEACKTEAGALRSAWVRLRIPMQGGVPKKVLILEPGVSPALRQCLMTHLAKLPLPSLGPVAQVAAIHGAVNAYTAPVPFRR